MDNDIMPDSSVPTAAMVALEARAGSFQSAAKEVVYRLSEIKPIAEVKLVAQGYLVVGVIVGNSSAIVSKI